MFTDPYLATVTIFGGNFAPLGWAFCDGSLQSIANNTALYSLIGTTYGGDGVSTFALPDLRGRVAIHTGQGPGLSNYFLGQAGGSETVVMTSNELPSHTHGFAGLTGSPGASADTGALTDPTGNVAGATGTVNTYNSTGTVNMAASINNVNTPVAGGSQPIPILSPFLVMNYIICMEGIFPSRN